MKEINNVNKTAEHSEDHSYVTFYKQPVGGGGGPLEKGKRKTEKVNTVGLS